MKFDKIHDYRMFIMAEDFSSDSTLQISLSFILKDLQDEILHEDPPITTKVAEVCS